MPQTLDTAWLIVASALVLVMQGGFCALEAGLVRARNNINVAAKNLADLCLSTAAFWAVGAWIMFGEGSLSDPSPAEVEVGWAAALLLFQALFCGTATTIISGAVAERVGYVAYGATVVFIAIAVYPVAGSWAWAGLDGGPPGWLEAMGFVDFAGSTVVHSVGGWAALAFLMVIGPRAGRFGPDGRNPQASNVPLSALGVVCLWVGWFGFNGGSTLAFDGTVPVVVLNTMLAACFGGIASQLLSQAIYRKVRIEALLNGILGGLVAVTAGAHILPAWGAATVGGIGGLAVVGASHLLVRCRIDDAVGAVPVHLAAGAAGTILLAVLAEPAALPLPRAEQLGVQTLGVLAIGGYSFAVSFLALKAIDRVTPLRVSAAAEARGLNMVEHEESSALIDMIDEMERPGQEPEALPTPVKVETGAEIEPVARQYNQVVGRVHAYTRHLEETMEQLVRAKSDAEAANNAKSAFLANMSHELRTPLNAVIGFAQVMEEESFGPLGGDGRYKQYVVTIREAGAHLLSVINDLLEHSRIEAGRLELDEESVDLVELLHQVRRLTEENAHQGGVALEATHDEDLPRLHADQRLVRQVLINLVSNAIKFTERDGKVRIDARVEPDGRMALVVSDTGIGMAREELRRALEPFTQLNAAYNKKHPGTGLGLPLVKAMMRLHGGSLTIDSMLGHGTTVTARFPETRTLFVDRAPEGAGAA
ncbi:MAG: ATP-binding protein [Marivibrio sp.]|uniref:ATP-binding protein n=1 Tax=Marivibrio sp. TaxID=2039719 RepID=UPI0032EF784F